MSDESFQAANFFIASLGFKCVENDLWSVIHVANRTFTLIQDRIL